MADQHRAARAVLADRVTRDSLALWRRMNIVELDASWNTIGPAIGRVVTLGQVDAARQTATFMQGVERITPTRFPGVDLAVESFGGVTLAGRDVTAEAFGAVATTKGLISQGVRSGDAFLRGAMSLAVLVGAAVQDIGRQADMTLATAKGFTSYVRVVSAGACSRCAILAGKEDYRTPFLRHPRCRCTSFPVQSDGATPDGMFSNSGAYFESLSPGEQNRVFTNAGAEAIRNGADPSKVVNARRGYFGSKPAGVPVRRLRPVQIGVRPDGSPLTVFATGEGTTVRGAFGRAETQAGVEATRQGSYRRTTSLRLMPEQIVRMAGDNRERLVELLQRYGYLY